MRQAVPARVADSVLQRCNAVRLHRVKLWHPLPGASAEQGWQQATRLLEPVAALFATTAGRQPQLISERFAKYGRYSTAGRASLWFAVEEAVLDQLLRRLDPATGRVNVPAVGPLHLEVDGHPCVQAHTCGWPHTFDVEAVRQVLAGAGFTVYAVTPVQSVHCPALTRAGEFFVAAVLPRKHMRDPKSYTGAKKTGLLPRSKNR